MIVATEGKEPGQVTAISLLSGVEPILSASPNHDQASTLLSPWNLGTSGGEAGATAWPEISKAGFAGRMMKFRLSGICFLSFMLNAMGRCSAMSICSRRALPARCAAWLATLGSRRAAGYGFACDPAGTIGLQHHQQPRGLLRAEGDSPGSYK